MGHVRPQTCKECSSEVLVWFRYFTTTGPMQDDLKNGLEHIQNVP